MRIRVHLLKGLMSNSFDVSFMVFGKPIPASLLESIKTGVRKVPSYPKIGLSWHVGTAITCVWRWRGIWGWVRIVAGGANWHR